MAFQLSPGVNVTEFDLTTVVPAVASTYGAIGGVFRWGPVGERVFIDSENLLSKRFGKPTNHNAETFFTAASFLAYANSLYVSRAARTVGPTPSVSVSVANTDLDGNNQTTIVTVANTSTLEAGMYVSQTSNSTIFSDIGADFYIVSVNSSAVVMSKTITSTANSTEASVTGIDLYFANPDTTYTSVATETSSGVVANLTAQIVKNDAAYDDLDGNFDSDVLYVAKYPGKLGNSLKVAVCDTAAGYSSNVDLSTDTAYVEFIVGQSNAYVISNTNSNVSVNTAYNALSVGDYILAGSTTSTQQYNYVTGFSYASNTTANVVFGASGANGGVNTTTGFIQFNNQSNATTGALLFNVGDIVTYSNTTGSSTAGLTDGDNYYITFANTSGAKISATRDGGSAVTAAADGTAHKFLADMNKITITLQDPFRLNNNYYSNTMQRFWEYFNVVDSAPGQSDFQRLNGNTSANDEIHVIVSDEDGDFTGTPGTVLEVFEGLSRATNARNNDNATNYYKTVINESSEYIRWANDRTTAVSNTAQNLTSATSTSVMSSSFRLGEDGLSETNATLSILGDAYDLFAAAEDVDISLVMQGKPIGGTTVVNGETVANYQLGNYIIDNIAEIRKDCVAFISPDRSKVLNNNGNEALSVNNWRGAVRNTSYGVLDSGYKYMYDRYNDIYRWIPLNGDIAGLCARTDATNDPWYSPAGYNRGNIKNSIKLAWNPRESERDLIYPKGINPVVTFPGEGTVMYGDKTLLAKPSAFDRINVRRLFIVLEKAISTSAKFSLFEFNDPFTRSQFKNLVIPYLRTVKGRRGITNFLVVCDESNNTAQIIDTNQFVGDIYIKPARSINWINLNFTAVGTSVQFSEVIVSNL